MEGSENDAGRRRSKRVASRFASLPSRPFSGTGDASSLKKADWTSSDSEGEMVDEEVEYNEPLSYFPPTHLVLRLSPAIQPAAVSWLVRKITGKKAEGGAELLARCEPFGGRKKEGLVMHVTASKLKFLELAEYMELKKLDSQGQLREFTVADLDNFLHGTTNLDNLLTPAEKQLIVIHELENIRASQGENVVPGYPLLSVFVGQSIFQIFLAEKLITSYYPLHDEEELVKLGDKWYWAFFSAQPFEEIRKYFGEGISLYFSFLGFYTGALCAPAALGLFHLFFPQSVSNYSLSFFCIFNVVWVTVTLELWKRKCAVLAYSWGTLRMTKWEDPRSNYRGTMAIDPVTGRYQPKFPWWKTCLRVYGVSFPIVLVCLFGAFYIMLYSFWVEEMLMEVQHSENASQFSAFLTYLPSIVYAVLVYIMNFYYRMLASHLTEWENHRTQSSVDFTTDPTKSNFLPAKPISIVRRELLLMLIFLAGKKFDFVGSVVIAWIQSQFDRNRVTKLVLFEFVNNFMSLFYIAFYLQDFEMLKYQVFVMLIILQGINHFQEAVLPLVLRKFYASTVTFMCAKCPKLASMLMDEEPSHKDKDNKSLGGTTSADDSIWNPESLGLQSLDENDPRIQISKFEGGLDPYEGTFDDYLEMFIQFGYVFLFSSVYPMAASWAILNNVLEIRADAFKLCKVFQRPIARRTKDIGAWQLAFEALGAIALMTNCGLLCLSPELREFAPHLSNVEWLLVFVVIEHCLLLLMIALRQLIPDVPTRVKQAMARLEYQSRQALKNEQTFKSRRQLTRRFKTIHGPRSGQGDNASSSSPNSNSPMTTRRRMKGISKET